MLRPILLDTDLGSDVDDKLALALLWGSPEVGVRGVCTRYGDPALRARIVLGMAELVGRSVAVAGSESASASGRAVWWAGIEGVADGSFPGLADPGSGGSCGDARSACRPRDATATARREKEEER